MLELQSAMMHSLNLQTISIALFQAKKKKIEGLKLRKNFPNNEFIVYILDERQRQMTEKNFLAFHRTYVSMDANTTSKHVEGPLQLLKGS